MGQVSAASTVLIDAEPTDRVGGSRGLSDRPPEDPLLALQRLPGSRGRTGRGHRGHLEAAGHQVAGARRQGHVDVAGHTVIEKDANSSMVTNWTVAPAGTGSSVTVKTSGQGAGGIGASSRRRLRRWGCKKIQAEVLENLKKEVEALAGAAFAEEGRDAAHHGVGVLLPALGAGDQRANRRGSSCCPARPGSTGTAPGSARRCRSAGSARRSRCRSRARCPDAAAGRA